MRAFTSRAAAYDPAMATDQALADELVGTIRAWVRKDVIPHASELEHADEYPAEMVAQMRMRLDAGEVAAARDLAHKLAGGLAMYGLKGASAEARAIEQDLMDPSPDAARAMQGVDALQARLARLAPGSAGGRV